MATIALTPSAVTTIAMTSMTTVSVTYHRDDCDDYYRDGNHRGEYYCADCDGNYCDDFTAMATIATMAMTTIAKTTIAITTAMAAMTTIAMTTLAMTAMTTIAVTYNRDDCDDYYRTDH